MRGSDDLMNSQNCGASFPALSRFYMSCRSQLAFWSIVTSFTVSVPSDACWISAMLVLLSEVVYEYFSPTVWLDSSSDRWRGRCSHLFQSVVQWFYLYLLDHFSLAFNISEINFCKRELGCHYFTTKTFFFPSFKCECTKHGEWWSQLFQSWNRKQSLAIFQTGWSLLVEACAVRRKFWLKKRCLFPSNLTMPPVTTTSVVWPWVACSVNQERMDLKRGPAGGVTL